MPHIKMSDFDDLKKNIFKKSPDIEEEYEKVKPLHQLQKEIIKTRIDRGLSQQNLAELVNTTQSVISKLESSKDYNPNLKTLIKVSEALNKNLDISLV
jgi:DNA-binding XRE family transcriptional regulator